MNLIKFKDTVVSGEDWYNENLRGKYAYWVRCRYVVPLESISQSAYVSYEKTINDLLGYSYYELTPVSGAIYSYVNVPISDMTERNMEGAVLVDEIPEEPTVDSPEFIKTDHSTVRYADLMQDAWMNNYVDQTETDIVNSVDKYKSYNNYTPTGDLTRDDLKRFRTWLAASLLNMNYTFYEYADGQGYVAIQDPSLNDILDAVEYDELPSEKIEGVIKVKNLNVVDWSEDKYHILTYYEEEMYDDTLKWIDEFSKINIGIETEGGCKCGCNTNISSLYNENLHVCDSANIYREGIKQGMVSFFSTIDTWSVLPSTYLLLVKEYIDGIININFDLTTDDTSNYYGCECLGRNGQSTAVSILAQLSTVFQYLAEGNISGHKYFIINILNQWSSNLYEHMEWK